MEIVPAILTNTYEDLVVAGIIDPKKVFVMVNL